MKDHAPAPLAVTEPTSMPSRYTFIVELASAVPVMTGALSLVMPSPSVPLSDAVARAAVGGVSGAVASMTRFNTTEADETLPAASVERVVIKWLPSTRGGDTKLHAPLAAAWVVPSSVAPS